MARLNQGVEVSYCDPYLSAANIADHIKEKKMTKPTPHKWAKEIHAFADGYEIEFREDENYQWTAIENPSWVDYVEYRIKPERKYPKSSLSDDELTALYVEEAGATLADDVRRIANAAIRRYIDDTEGQDERSGYAPTRMESEELEKLFEAAKYKTVAANLRYVVNMALLRHYEEKEGKQ